MFRARLGIVGHFRLNTIDTPLPVRYTTFENTAALTKTDISGSFGELVTMIKNPKTYPKKTSCPWIKLATFGDDARQSGCLRHDANVMTVTGIEGDYDAGLMSIEYARDTLSMFDVRGVLYTSASHTPEKPRWRVLLPLSRPHKPTERHKLVARLNGLLGGSLAPESFTLSQSYFYGRVEGTEYEAHETQGYCIDELDMYASDAIGPKISPCDDQISPHDGMILPHITDKQLADLKSAVMHLASKGHGDKYPEWAATGQALKAESINGRDDELKGLWLEYSRVCKGFTNECAFH